MQYIKAYIAKLKSLFFAYFYISKAHILMQKEVRGDHALSFFFFIKPKKSIFGWLKLNLALLLDQLRWLREMNAGGRFD